MPLCAKSYSRELRKKICSKQDGQVCARGKAKINKVANEFYYSVEVEHFKKCHHTHVDYVHW